MSHFKIIYPIFNLQRNPVIILISLHNWAKISSLPDPSVISLYAGRQFNNWAGSHAICRRVSALAEHCTARHWCCSVSNQFVLWELHTCRQNKWPALHFCWRTAFRRPIALATPTAASCVSVRHLNYGSLYVYDLYGAGFLFFSDVCPILYYLRIYLSYEGYCYLEMFLLTI